MNLKKLLLLVLALSLLGCVSGNPDLGQGNSQDAEPGTALAVNIMLEDYPDNLAGVTMQDENHFSVNPALSSRQKITVTIGNRTRDVVYFDDSGFSCMGKNLEENSDAEFVLEDFFFECVNCPYKESCTLSEPNSEYDEETNCVFEKGKKPLSIGKEQGLNMVAIVRTSADLKGEAVCILNIDTHAEKINREFYIIYSGE